MERSPDFYRHLLVEAIQAYREHVISLRHLITQVESIQPFLSLSAEDDDQYSLLLLDLDSALGLYGEHIPPQSQEILRSDLHTLFILVMNTANA